jgi:enamine deaminase RidA (YjgF/YER057c/UK114 family)
MTIAKEVCRFGPWQDMYVQGVRVGDALHLAGQVSIDEEGRVVGAGDLAAQCRQAYANVARVLAAYGATLQNVVEETVFVTDIAAALRRIDEFTALRHEIFGGPPEVAQTLVQVAALALPDLLVEIKCVAYLSSPLLDGRDA